MCVYLRRRTSLLSKVSTPGGGFRACTVFRCSSMSRGMSRRRASTFLKRSARIRSRLWPFGGMSTRGARTGSHSRSQPPFSASKVPKVPFLRASFLATAASRREAAVARKQALRDGTFGTFDPEKGGWLREWDPVRAPRVLIPPKGHKRDRTRAERFRNVEARLQDMPRLIEEHRKTVQARKPPPGVETLLKRLVRRRK